MRYHRTVAFRLNCFALLGLAALLAVSTVAIHFAHRTQAATAVLMEDGIKGRRIAARLEMLLQQHRGIVESAPAEIDRTRLRAGRQSLDRLDAAFAAELAGAAAMQAPGAESVRELAARLGQDLPHLVAAAAPVLTLAWDFVQDQAVAAAQGPYAAVAERMQLGLARWSEERSVILDRQVALLDASAGTLISRVMLCAACGLVLVALSTIKARRLLHLMERLKEVMLRLARNDVDVTIPCQERADGIGDVARAAQEFKLSVIRTAEQGAALARTTAQFETALENMSQGLCLYDAEDRLLVFNRHFSQLYELDHARLRPGMTFREVLELRLASGNHPGATADDMLRQRAEQRASEPEGISLQWTGHGRAIAIAQRNLPDGGWVVTYEDVTGRRAAEEKVLFLARHDALTALPNRSVLDERLAQVVADSGRGVASAVLFLDLDRFKMVNDTLGHRVGDLLLCAVADRLRAAVRETDMVARLGGDEFAIVLGGIARPEDASWLADRIIAAISAAVEIEGHQIVVDASIGIALAPEDGDTAERLLRNADLALYRAKGDGRGVFRFFEAGMDARLQDRRQMEVALRQALAEGQFEMFYQPLVNLARGEVSGFEALLRWRHPERGLVSPAEFIPVLEETGLIVSVGAWVLRRACRDAASWPGSLKVAVNLSAAQFKGQLAATVSQALRDSGLDARRLELEITETLLLQDSEGTIATLHELRALGLRIAMDDFGTGYSSLSYLRSFPFDKVKIDQSFIRDLSVRENAIHVVRAVAGLCDGLGIAINAEGVETREQLEKLRAEGCTEVQGFLFSQPKPAHLVRHMIHAAGTLAQRLEEGAPAA